jgi:hypothetical protein
VDAERSWEFLKLEYAGGVGAVMGIDGSSSGKVPKLSSLCGAVSVELNVLLAEVVAGRNFGEVFVAQVGAGTVAVDGIAAVVASLVAFIKFSLAVFRGSNGLANGPVFV